MGETTVRGTTMKVVDKISYELLEIFMEESVIDRAARKLSLMSDEEFVRAVAKNANGSYANILHDLGWDCMKKREYQEPKIIVTEPIIPLEDTTYCPPCGRGSVTIGKI